MKSPNCFQSSLTDDGADASSECTSVTSCWNLASVRVVRLALSTELLAVLSSSQYPLDDELLPPLLQAVSATARTVAARRAAGFVVITRRPSHIGLGVGRSVTDCD